MHQLLSFHSPSEYRINLRVSTGVQKNTMFFDKTGKRITTEQWAALFEDLEYRRVGHDVLPNGTEISTVWLGLNHNYMPDAPPLIFETMVFPPDARIDMDIMRYTRLTEAQAGHAMMVAKWRPLDALSFDSEKVGLHSED